MDVPILRQGPYLVASVQGELSDQDLQRLADRLAETIRSRRSRGVVIDLTVLDVVDSFATRVLRSITSMTRLLGADTVIVGIQPEVAFSMVQLGLTLEDTPTALDLDDAIQLLDERRSRSQR